MARPTYPKPSRPATRTAKTKLVYRTSRAFRSKQSMAKCIHGPLSRRDLPQVRGGGPTRPQTAVRHVLVLRGQLLHRDAEATRDSGSAPGAAGHSRRTGAELRVYALAVRPSSPAGRHCVRGLANFRRLFRVREPRDGGDPAASRSTCRSRCRARFRSRCHNSSQKRTFSRIQRSRSVASKRSSVSQ